MMNSNEVMKSRQPRWWHPFRATIAFSAAAVAVYLLPRAGTSLEYSRHALAGGEFWRFITSHWTHYTFDHFFWDLLAFVWLGAFCEKWDRKSYLICTVGSALAVSGCVHIFMPELFHYRGLSGIDSALFGLLAASRLKRAAKRAEWRRCLILGACLSLFASKVAYETISGSALFVNGAEAGLVPVPLAHAVGFAIGAAIGSARTVDSARNAESRIGSVRNGPGSTSAICEFVSRVRKRNARDHSSPAERSTAL